MSTTELLEKYISYLGVKQGRARSAAHIREVHRRVSRMLAGLESVDVLTSERIEATLYELAQEIVTKPGSPPRARERADDRRLQARTRNVLPLAPEASRPHDEPGRRRRSLRGGRPARPLAAVLPPPSSQRFSRTAQSSGSQSTCSGRRPDCALARPGGSCGDSSSSKPSDGSSPYVEIWRSTAKNRKAVRQPLHPDVVKLLAPFVRKSTDAAFPSIPTPNTFLKDLRAAGLESVRSTAEGRLSRTSLRKLFATSLARGGTPLPLTQRLMRHSTPNLTSNVYTNFEVDEKARAVEQLGFCRRGGAQHDALYLDARAVVNQLAPRPRAPRPRSRDGRGAVRQNKV
jgi:hypothetical protein